MELRDQAERRQSILLDEPVNILHDSYILSFKLSNLVASGRSNKQIMIHLFQRCQSMCMSDFEVLRPTRR